MKTIAKIFTGKSADTPECNGNGRRLIGSDGKVTFACTYQPDFVTNSANMLVFENFFYMASALGVASATPKEKDTPVFPLVTTPALIKAASNKMCALDYTSVQNTYPLDSQGKDNNIKFCFVGSYSYSFLVEGLGIASNKQITTQKEVGSDVEIEWALGAAYKEAADFLKRSNLRAA